MGTMVIGKYKITYSNGVSQELNLIDQNDFYNTIKPLLSEIEKTEVAKLDSTELKNALKQLTGGEYFTTGSPIYKAKETGILSVNGYTGPCTVEQVL